MGYNVCKEQLGILWYSGAFRILWHSWKVLYNYLEQLYVIVILLYLLIFQTSAFQLPDFISL